MVLLTSEFDLIDEIRSRLPGPTRTGESWIGDDAAVVLPPDGWLLLAADSVVAGVHADLSVTTLSDLGWKAMASCISDIAAMGGEVDHALVTVAAPAGTDIRELYEGVADAAQQFACPVVGGDLSRSESLVVTVAVTGHCQGSAVGRHGARPGDLVWVTGPLGAAAAGLRLYRQAERPDSSDGPLDGLRLAHARPRARLAEGRAAREVGATAMIDVSDGLAADLYHLATSSGVGVQLDSVPVAPGATLDEALGGGEDFVLAFCAPESAPVEEAFRQLDTPIRVGRCTASSGQLTLGGTPLDPSGWEHSW